MQKYDSTLLEKEIRDHWKSIDLASLLKKHRSGEKTFYLLDGPPYVNALPHVGHIKTTTCKDIWSKFKLMQGFDSWFQPGFDCHGLPVENMVEKDLGITSKDQIQEMGIEKFDKACLSKVLNNEKSWIKVYNLLGAWRGLYEPYFTYKNYYIESAWWTIKQMNEKGLLKRGKLAIHWCSHCETALAGYEVSDSYKNVTDPTIYIKFKVKGQDNTFFLVYTTTPWTLPGNAALVVSAKHNYVKIRVENEFYIIAEALVKKVAQTAGFQYEIIETLSGSELEGLEYEPILNVPVQKNMSKKAHRVYLSIPIMKFKKYKKHETKAEDKEEYGEFATVDEGTGIVHSAPGHGSSDNFIGKHYKLDEVSPVNEKGEFTEEAGKYSNMYVKKADKVIMKDLRDQNKLLYNGTVTHSYPLCWRCKTPLIFRLSDQWYLSVEPIKEKMISENSKVKWLPSFGQKRFANWLVERTDWCISQQRYWGIPMPIWLCDCGKIEVIGSAKELREQSVTDPGELKDLHRHSVDGIKLKCSCGKEMSRIPDIFNVWFDSGISPWASLGYPYQNKELFEKLFPCDLIVESQDQIRGWFDSLMFTSIGTFDKNSYKSVGMMGWVLDAKGIKMSKSLGNVVWADEGLKRLGADAIRLYYCFDVAPWDIQKFSERSCIEVRRHLNILWNLNEFYKTYCKAPKGNETLAIEDQWLMSRMNSVIKKYTNHLEEFEFHLAGRIIIDFLINDFSRWYVKLIRDRLGEQSVSNVFYYCLNRTIRLLAPITPFISEKIYLETFKKKDSIHLEDFPKKENCIKDELEGKMQIIKNIVEASNSLRLENKIRLKYPLKGLTVGGNDFVLKAVKDLSGILKNMANVKEVKTEKRDVSYTVKLNFASAGKKFGAQVKKVSQEVAKADPNKLKKEIDKGPVKIGSVTLDEKDLLFTSTSKEGKPFEGGFVKLDTTVTPELKKEWLTRELIRAIQAKRKELNLKVTDKVKVCLPEDLSFAEKQVAKITKATVTVGKVSGKESSIDFEGKVYAFGVET